MKPIAEPIISAPLAPMESETPPRDQRDARIARDPNQYNPAPTVVRRLCAGFWLNYFFWHAERFPRLTRWTKWIYLFFALNCSKTIQLSTAANARRIFGAAISPRECRAFRNAVVSNFFNFIADVAASIHMNREQLLRKVECIHGEEKYLAARANGRGAIIASVHMGSFEVAAAALHLRETRIHVVFKRDSRSRFDDLRTRARQNLDIIEAPVDDGWGIWVPLRDALNNNEVVMLQADRVMPGQKGLRLPFLHGHLLLPTGPVRLAKVTGSPIIPIISTRNSVGKIQIHIEDAIHIDPTEPLESSMIRVKNIVENYVRTYPEQWLMLEPAFCEDQT